MTRHRWQRWRGALLGFCVLLVCTGAPAQDAAFGERIVDFRSAVAVDRDGGLTVTETIAVLAGGDQIKRGIYRDFPTSYDGPLGTRVQVPFEVVKIERDGQDEPFHTESLENGVRIYIGQADVQLSLGPHTYRITYRTARQIGFFADHDELYWNATGNGWAFPIERATATVTLPAEVPRERVTLEGYTGPNGSTEQALTAAVDPRSGALTFATTRQLEPYEGLTIVATFPKGFVREPAAAERREAWLQSNRHLVAGAAGFGLVLLYYLLAWVAVGRDPARGTIIPLFEPPLGLDAPGVRYVDAMRYDERCFTAALVSLGVKGWLRIEEKDGAFTLRRAQGRSMTLSGAERALNTALLGGQDELALEQKNNRRVRAGIEALRRSLGAEYEGAMFRANGRWLWPGLVLSVATLLALGWYGPGPAGSFAMAMILLWLSVWTYACLSLFEGVRRGWHDAVRPGIGVGTRLLAGVVALFVTAFALPFFAGEVFGLFALGQVSSVWTIPLTFLLAGTNWLFSYLLKQPTGAGQRVMDQIAGFRMYLTTAEGDELRQAPPRTPQLFEAMLPFAIALGVEHAWSERFTDVLAAAATHDRDGGRPLWYGGSWSPTNASHFSSMVGSSLSTAVASSSVAPGSRSGSSGSSGGGSAGGGGGGGGGGGW